MSNAKRRHRRRWRRGRVWLAVLAAERELVAEGYTLSGDNGVWREWMKLGPAPDWAPVQECLWVQTVDVP